MKKFIILGFLMLIVFTLSACSTAGQSGSDTPVTSPFVFEETEHDFGVIKQSGGIVEHEFRFTYTGEESITVTATPGSCACTTAETDKETYQPGESGILTVFFNPNLHAEPTGRFYKTISIWTEPRLDREPEVKVWQEIDLDLGEGAF